MKIPEKILIFPAIFLLLSACAVGPDYVRPSVDVPDRFKEAKGKAVMGSEKNKNPQKHAVKPTGQWKEAAPEDACNRGEWWKIFNDAKLNMLEAHLDISNQTIKNAYENWQQARALVDEARAAFWPTLTGSLGFTRQSQGSGFASSGTSTSGTTTGTTTSSSSVSNSYQWMLNASWEPDIWGSVRRTVEAAAAGAQASDALLALTQLSAQASLAQYYFELRGLDSDQKLLDDTVKKYRKILTYTKNRYAEGVDQQTDIIQAKSQLETALAAAINNQVLRSQYEHAIAVLTGVPPAEFSMAANPLTAVPPPIPLEVPSVLLERRPDIAQAERLMAQANAQIGVAVAAWFPTLTLSGLASTTTQKLFSVPELTWSLGAQLAETLLDGGLRSATVRAAESGYRASVANYRQTVLAAFQNVEDNLAALRILAKQAVYQNRAALDAKHALQLTINQYRAGTVDYSSVLTAQITSFTAEKTARDLQYLRMTTAVGLIKALGGGWDEKLMT